MMRKRTAAVCTLLAAFAFGTPSATAFAQDEEVIDLEEDDDGDIEINLDEDQGYEPDAVVAGEMTEEAAQAKRLFDGDRWAEASLALFRVVNGETGDDPGNRQLAQYYLAISLYRLKFYQPSYAIFSVIADNTNHLKFNETLLWLAKLATQLPEPADIIERVGKYSDKQVARFDNEQQRDLYFQLNYLLGRYKYRNREFNEAIRLFNKVPATSPYYVKSQFFTGISYVEIRKSVPAVESFGRIITALDEGVEGVEDEGRMRDLAYLSMARTYYSASIRLDPDTNQPTVNAEKLSMAVKYWDKISVSSEYWLPALFEASWAYFMAGSYPKALGNIHTLQSPYFPNSFYPEADILKAVIFFTNCNYDAAEIVVARFDQHYMPIKTDLEKILERFEGANQEEPFFKFLKEVRAGTAEMNNVVRPVVDSALGDRTVIRNLEYVRVLEEEIAHFAKAPANFREAELGQEIKDTLQIARDLAVRQAGELALSRYQRNLAELDEHLRNGEKIMVDVTYAIRNQLDKKLQQGQVSAAEAKIYGVVNPDQEHVLWPFDGEYWRDELGYYRQVVETACGGR